MSPYPSFIYAFIYDAQASGSNKAFSALSLSLSFVLFCLAFMLALTPLPASATDTAVDSHSPANTVTNRGTNTVAATSNLADDESLLTQNAQSLTTPAALTSPVASPINNQGDAIEQFVAADFSQRQAMLGQWPDTAESLDTLVELIDNDELYQGNGGQTYLLNACLLYTSPSPRD